MGSLHRPTLFNGTNYTFWKVRMRIFIQATNFNAWKVITDGPYDSEKLQGLSEDQRDRFLSLNAKAIHFLYCALDVSQFILISSCDTAKEIWDKLEIIYEGTPQVKGARIDILIRKCELFSMQDDESVSEMLLRFCCIINELKCLGKEYPNSYLNWKILSNLPSSWDAKVVAIETAKDLAKLSFDELMGNLLTYEMRLREDSESSEKPPTKSSVDKKVNELKKENEVACYKCKRVGHFKNKCPLLKRNEKKKAMIATWSGEDSSTSELDGEGIAEMCLTAL